MRSFKRGGARSSKWCHCCNCCNWSASLSGSNWSGNWNWLGSIQKFPRNLRVRVDALLSVNHVFCQPHHLLDLHQLLLARDVRVLKCKQYPAGRLCLPLPLPTRPSLPGLRPHLGRGLVSWNRSHTDFYAITLLEFDDISLFQAVKSLVARLRPSQHNVLSNGDLNNVVVALVIVPELAREVKIPPLHILAQELEYIPSFLVQLQPGWIGPIRPHCSDS
mmetsp:Transcript_14237/g.27438  ORF Transcript_14237/g.27438 Transcript_14237/m.27438 type:complete len:219 (+) Transcript_14237:458-1114(+)